MLLLLLHLKLAALTVLQTADPLVVTILKAALGIILPSVATYAATAVTKLTGLTAHFKSWEVQLLATVYGICMAGISHAVGVTLPSAWGALGSADVQAALTAGVAMLLHRIFKGPPTP